MTMSKEGEKRIWIFSASYALLFRKILQGYGGETEIRIDGRVYADGDIPDLVERWCSSRKIRRTGTFELVFHGRTLFGFQGGPRNLWAVYSELAFVQHLEESGVVRCIIGSEQPGLFRRLMHRRPGR
jgi:hypothetical protein